MKQGLWAHKVSGKVKALPEYPIVDKLTEGYVFLGMIEVEEPKTERVPLTENEKIENLRLAHHDMDTFERGYRRAKEYFSRTGEDDKPALSRKVTD